MTFTSTASDRQPISSQSLEFLKISTAVSALTALGIILLQYLLWMPASTPAEVPTACQQQRTLIK